mgnify:CR=1 FL=1|jgi:hypothetical protein
MAENVSVKDLVNEIKTGLSQTSSSHKDEVRVMRAMLNDKNFEVGVYAKEGQVGTYNPCQDYRSMCANVVSGIAKIPMAEAEALAENYEAKRSDAETMVNISKEFVNTFIQTGRKLPLGGRETSDVALSLKQVPETTRSYPKKVGVNDDGTDRYSKAPTKVGAHDSIRVHAPCPTWVK